MLLGFHYHTPILSRGGKFYTPAYFGFFLDSLASHCEKLILFMYSPLDSELELMDYQIQSVNIELVNLGPHNSIPKRLLRSHISKARIKKYASSIDAFLIRGPTPLLPIISNTVQKPISFLLISDTEIKTNYLTFPIWKRGLIKLYLKFYHWKQLEYEKRALIFVNSQNLFDKIKTRSKNVILVKTTTLRESDFFFRPNTCLDKEVRLLFTGRINRAKGVFLVLQSMEKLLKRGYDLRLDLVGPVAKNDSIIQELFAYAETNGFSDKVEYHGYKSAGHELLKYYRKADIFIMPSMILSEGFPRTIWEAMSQSTPVIATSVGSIYSFINDAAEIIEPNNLSALSEAIEKIIQNKDLRGQRIKVGFKKVKNNTLEIQSFEIVKKIRQWVGSKNG